MSQGIQRMILGDELLREDGHPVEMNRKGVNNIAISLVNKFFREHIYGS